MLKIIPHVDGTPRICEIVEYYLDDIDLKGAWTGPGALELHPHALAPVAELPVLEVISATHIIADLTLGLARWSTIICANKRLSALSVDRCLLPVSSNASVTNGSTAEVIKRMLELGVRARRGRRRPQQDR